MFGTVANGDLKACVAAGFAQSVDEILGFAVRKAVFDIAVGILLFDALIKSKKFLVNPVAVNLPFAAFDVMVSDDGQLVIAPMNRCCGKGGQRAVAPKVDADGDKLYIGKPFLCCLLIVQMQEPPLWLVGKLLIHQTVCRTALA